MFPFPIDVHKSLHDPGEGSLQTQASYPIGNTLTVPVGNIK